MALENLTIRLTEPEKNEVAARAKSAGLSQSEYMRKLIAQDGLQGDIEGNISVPLSDTLKQEVTRQAELKDLPIPNYIRMLIRRESSDEESESELMRQGMIQTVILGKHILTQFVANREESDRLISHAKERSISFWKERDERIEKATDSLGSGQ